MNLRQEMGGTLTFGIAGRLGIFPSSYYNLMYKVR